MLQNAHFGAGSDALQQVHGAGVKSNHLKTFLFHTAGFTCILTGIPI